MYLYATAAETVDITPETPTLSATIKEIYAISKDATICTVELFLP